MTPDVTKRKIQEALKTGHLGSTTTQIHVALRPANSSPLTSAHDRHLQFYIHTQASWAEQATISRNFACSHRASLKPPYNQVSLLKSENQSLIPRQLTLHHILPRALNPVRPLDTTPPLQP